MMITIDPERDLDEVWHELEAAGFNLLYSIEENGEKNLFGDLPEAVVASDLIRMFPFILKIGPDPFTEIDWDSQWAQHGHGYKDGYLHIDLGIPIKLKPGPGFGDLSHPTTRLMLQLMPKCVAGRDVLDIGCGSGVLSVAAVALGAKQAFGIDIDEGAVEHSKVNAELNGMQNEIYCTSSVNELLKRVGNLPLVVLINMIASEQKIAWDSLKRLHGQAACVLASGILKEGAEGYLKSWVKAGWKLVECVEEEGWIGFVLKT